MAVPRLLALLHVLLASWGSPQSVAIYFVGEPRTLNYSFSSFVNNVFQPLYTARVKRAVFVYSYNHPTHSQYEILHRLPDTPVRIHADPIRHVCPLECAEPLVAQMRVVRRFGVTYARELVASYYHRLGADRLRRQYEQENRMQFDWVYFVRPDVVYINPVPVPSVLSPEVVTVLDWQQFNGVNDRFFAVPRKFMEPFANLYTFMCTNNRTANMPQFVQHPETLAAWHFNSSGVKTALTPSPFFFLRLRMAVFNLTNNTFPCPFHQDDLILNNTQLDAALEPICAVANVPLEICNIGLRVGCARRFHWFFYRRLRFKRNAQNGHGIMPRVHDPWWKDNRTVYTCKHTPW